MADNSFSLDSSEDFDSYATSHARFGEALFIVSRSGNRATIAIRAPDALVRGVAAQYHDGKQPEPRLPLLFHQKGFDRRFRYARMSRNDQLRGSTWFFGKTRAAWSCPDRELFPRFVLHLSKTGNDCCQAVTRSQNKLGHG